MSKCKVTANSKRGKQLIKEHGDVWYMTTGVSWRMPCFDGALGFSIYSLDSTHGRNVRMIDDKVLNVYYIMEDNNE